LKPWQKQTVLPAESAMEKTGHEWRREFGK